MKARTILVASALASLAFPISSAAAPVTTRQGQYAQLASKVMRSEHPSHALALFYLEQALRANLGKPRRFGPLQGRYQALVARTGSFARAVNFYARLKHAHPDDVQVLASYGNMIGGLLGWLQSQSVPPPATVFKSYNHKAMASYARALRIQPDNFAAWLGRSIYLSHTPNGLARSVTGFRHLIKLRDSHPDYPYALVYRQWAAALRRNGKSQRAQTVMQHGYNALGQAAFRQSRH